MEKFFSTDRIYSFFMHLQAHNCNQLEWNQVQVEGNKILLLSIIFQWIFQFLVFLISALKGGGIVGVWWKGSSGFISWKGKEHVLLWLCPSLQQTEYYSILGEWSPVKHCRAHRGKQQVNCICSWGPLFFVAFILFWKEETEASSISEDC